MPLSSFVLSLVLTAPVSGHKPNLILIVADDLGWGDLSVYGSKEIRTPVLDGLAHVGVRFTQFYSVSPVCSPSRAALLTGLLPPRTGIIRVLHPGARQGLPGNLETLPEVLQARGYVTAAVGKWHLGDAVPHLPAGHGFHEFFGIPYSNDMVPLRLVRDSTVIDPNPTQAFLTRDFTDEAINFVDRNAGNPFFLYLSLKTPHVPLAVPDAWRNRSRSLYIDSVEYMDWNLGRLLQRLEDLKLDRRTVIAFTSDNGSWRLRSNGGLRGAKKSVYEGGIRVPLIVAYPGLPGPPRVIDAPAMMCDLFPTLVRMLGETEPEGLDGRHLLGLVDGERPGAPAARRPGDPIFFFLRERVAAVRAGRWKLHLQPAGPTPQTPDQLFDLEADPGESRNLLEQHPQVARRLRSLVAEYEAN